MVGHVNFMGYTTMFIMGSLVGMVILWLVIDTKCYIAPKKERGKR